MQNYPFLCIYLWHKGTCMKHEKWEDKSGKGLILVFILTIIILVIGGVAYLKNEEAEYTQQALKQLQKTAEYHARHVEKWRNEILADMDEISQSPLLGDAENALLKNMADTNLARKIRERLLLVTKYNTDFANLFLASPSGKIILAGHTGCTDLSISGQLINEALQNKRKAVGSLFRCGQDHKIYMDVAVPVASVQDKLRAVLLFRISPENNLFPILGELQTDSSTEESFLFEKSGDSVLYLTNLRSLPNAALSLKFPLTNIENPAVRAVKNGPGFYEGIGYHDQKVLEYIQPVKDSPWFLASKIDRDELFKPLHQHLKKILFVFLLIFLLVAASLFLLINYRRKHFYLEIIEEERKLQALKSHYEYVVKYANDIILLDDNDLNIFEANEKALQVYQYSLEELRRMKITDLISPAFRPFFDDLLKTAVENDGIFIESIHQRKDGSLFDVEISARVITVEGKKYLHQIIRDITERKQAEVALRESEERFRTTLYSTGDAIITTDPDGQIRYMNPTAEALTGWTEAEASGKPIREVFCVFNEDTREEIESPVEKVLAKDMVVMLSNHTFLKSRNGMEIPIGDSGAPIRDSKGKITGVVMVFRDQTRERETQRIIRESEEKYRKAFQTSPDAVNINRLDGLYVEINEGFTDLTGFTRDEAIGKLSSEINIWAIPEDREMLVAGLKENGLVHNLESSFRCKDGSLKTALMSANLITLNNEPHILSIIRDITERVENYRILHESDERWSNLFNNSPDAIAIYQAVDDSNDFVFTDFNLQAQKTDNLTHDEVVGKRITELFPSAEELGLLDVFRKVWRTGETEYLNLSFYKDNRIEGWRENIIYKLNTGEIVAIYNDVSERENTRITLSKSEKKFRKLFDEHAATKLIIDPVSGNIIEANTAASEFYGYTKEEFKSMNISQINILSPEAIEREMKKAQTLSLNFFEFSHRLKDGSIKDVAVFTSPVEIEGKVYLHSIIQNITQSKLAEKQVKLLGRAIDQNPVTIIITNTNGDIEYVNPKFTEVTGYVADEVIGKNPRMLQSGEHDQKFYKDLWDTILSGNDWHGEFHNKKKNGEDYWESAIISPVFDDSGKISSFVAVKEDITEKKKMIQDLIIAKEQAQESDRLKSAFLATISHELRTPLNAVIGFSSLIEKEMPMEQVLSFAQMINNSGNNLLEIVEGIFDLTLLESGDAKPMPEIFELGNFMSHILELFKEEKRKTGNWQVEIEQVKHIDDEALSIHADKQKITKVFVNLFRNALKFTRSGKIEFGYEFDQERKTNRITFFVKDTGIGIPENQKVLIFEKFRQADDSYTRKYDGIGIGLAICGKTVELLGGHIGVDSELGRGSTFYFTIPFVELQQPQPNHGNDENEKKRFSSQTILIAEDDNSNFKYLDHLLKQAKLQVVRAHDGQEAINLCLSHPNISLVLMDIKMPKMNGFEATKKIKASKPEIPVIAVTAFAMDGDREKSLAEGCDEYLEKPIKREKLFTLLQRFIQ